MLGVEGNSFAFKGRNNWAVVIIMKLQACVQQPIAAQDCKGQNNMDTK
jgi:hypothetical protein